MPFPSPTARNGTGTNLKESKERSGHATGMKALATIFNAAGTEML